MLRLINTEYALERTHNDSEAGGRRQEGGGMRQEGGGWRDEAGGRRQEAGGRRDEGGGRREEWHSRAGCVRYISHKYVQLVDKQG